MELTDSRGIGGYTMWEPVPAAVIEAVAHRTPGFDGWQGERWFTHCGDAAEFLAIAGRSEQEALGAEAVDAIHQECGYEGEEWDFVFHVGPGSGPYAMQLYAVGTLGRGRAI